MTCGITVVDNTLNRSFYKLGYFVGKHPGYFLIVPILLAALCITGFQKMEYEIDPEYLFSPVSGAGKTERNIAEELFKVNYTHRFNAGRITRPGRFGRLIVVSKDEDSNMLRPEIFRELRLLDEMIVNASVPWEDGSFTYKDACAKWLDNCFPNDVINLDKIIDDVQKGELKLTWPLMFNPVTWETHVFPVFFGGTHVDEDDLIVDTHAIHLVYFVTADTKLQDAKGSLWEEAFLETAGKAQDSGMFKHISIARFASRTLDHELEKNTRGVVPYFGSTFGIMCLFSILTCMMSDWVRAKPWLGLLGILSAVMATAAAFGFAMYLGHVFIGINLAAPFLMIGIGIDDTFVMLAAWRRTSIKQSVPDRMAKSLSEAAVSITITSVTDMVSFWIGVVSPFPSVKIFCIYSSLAVCFTFIWHLTFFASCMAIAGYCENKNLHSLVCVKVLPVSRAIKEKRSWIYRIMCTGGVDPADPDDPIDNKEHMIMAFFRDKVATLLNKGWVKCIVVFVFILYLMGAGYGVSNIKEGLERRKLSKDDSYSVLFFDMEDYYFKEFPYRIQVIISGAYNYSDPMVQAQVEELTRKLENSTYISSPLYTESWLRSFVSYIGRNSEEYNVTYNDEQSFIKTLKEIWLYPSNPFSLDVKFNQDETQIIASRFLIQAVNVSDTNLEKDMAKQLRQICHDSPLNASVFHPYFVFFDQYELIRPVSLQNMILGAIIMMFISFIFIPNIMCAIWVAFSIISIETGVVGYMALWNVNLDCISMINLIMCIGFSVDFTAHICYAYMASKGKTPDEKVRECLYSLGLPIVQGAMSTILGVVALLLADSYIFTVFFKMVFMVIFFGAMHGLFLLPVLLSLFGPASCTSIKDEEEINMSKVEKAFPNPYCIPHPQLVLNESLYNGKNFKALPFKGYNDEKDLGIGTSGEDSSESSSSQSQRRRAVEDETTRRRYEEGWRKSHHQLSSQSQFVPQLLDLYGYDAERAWHRQLQEGNRRNNHYVDQPSRNDERGRRTDDRSKVGRKISPSERPIRSHSTHALQPQRAPQRSSSYHNLQHKYIAERRY